MSPSHRQVRLATAGLGMRLPRESGTRPVNVTASEEAPRAAEETRTRDTSPRGPLGTRDGSEDPEAAISAFHRCKNQQNKWQKHTKTTEATLGSPSERIAASNALGWYLAHGRMPLDSRRSEPAVRCMWY